MLYVSFVDAATGFRVLHLALLAATNPALTGADLTVPVHRALALADLISTDTLARLIVPLKKERSSDKVIETPSLLIS